MRSKVEAEVARHFAGQSFDMDTELDRRYAGRTVRLGEVRLVQRLQRRPVTAEQIARAAADGDGVMHAILTAQHGLTADTPVTVRTFINAGFRGIEVQVERADKPGCHLTLAVAELDEALLTAR